MPGASLRVGEALAEAVHRKFSEISPDTELRRAKEPAEPGKLANPAISRP
jgi:hypothetical protein